MLRKLAIAIAASGAMMSATNVLALGMGDIELESALNQPLDARIKLLKASELEDWEMKPNLASTDEFEKSGVEHVFFLNNLQFAIERSGDDVYVHVTSNQAVVEPFLNFLVQVDWPNGRLLREYTLLLDPPVFNEEPTEPVQPAQVDGYAQDDIADESMALPGTAPSAMAPASSAPSAEKMVQEAPKAKPQAEPKESVYKVRANDTLWEVAIRTRANRSISPQQAMLAIQDLNPNAFINGNINRLKKNQVLRVPDEQQMLSRTFDEAVSEVALQNQATAKRKAQLDATRKDAAMQRDDKLSGAQLKLLAGGEATTDNERSASGQVAAKTAGDQSKLEKDLSITLENLDKTTRENQELRSRLDSLEEQINTLQRLINLKDEQMVALQSGMAAKPAKPAQDAMPAAKPMAKPGEDLNFADASSKPKSLEEKATPDAAKKAEAPKPKPVLAPPVEEEFDPVAFVMDNPPVLGAGLGALLLALLGINYARKRKEKTEEEKEAQGFDAQDPLADASLGDDFNEDFTVDQQEGDLDLGGFNEGDLSDFEDDNSDAGLLGDSDSNEQSEDVLGEVDVYMAYNRLEPARALLEKTIEAQPARMDLRLKMIEVLSSMDDSEAMAEHAEFINANGSEEDKSAASQFQSGADAVEEVNEDFAMDFGLDDDLSESNDSLSMNELESDLTLDEESSDLDFDLDGLELSGSDDLETDLDFSSDLDVSLDDDLDSSLDFSASVDDAETDLDIALDEPDDSNSMDFDLSDFETSADAEVSLDDIEEPAGLELDPSLDALSLDSSDTAIDLDMGESDLGELQDNELSFDLNEESDETNSLDFDLSESDSMDIPELSSTDDLDDLSFETTDENEEISLDFESDLDLESNDLDLGDLNESSDDLEFSSLELDSADDSLPEFEEDLSFDEEEMDLPELTDEISDDLDSELESLAGDDIELPTLETPTDDLNELPELDDDFDISVATPAEELESVDEVAAEYKEELPSLDDAVDGDDFPPLGDLDDIDLDNLDSDLDFLSGTDESETKLDLARAYIDMEDQDGAREILQEVLEEGTDEQKQEATKLMDGLV